MVSHSSSSLSLSRTSHASTSSSHSSPPSSPDHNSLTPPNHSPSPRRITPGLSSAIVPFSWEEKPGVLKKQTMQTSHLDGHACHVDHELDVHADIAGDENLQPFHKHARTSHTGKVDLPQIRPPPCLSHLELHANTVEGCEFTRSHMLHQHHQHHHPGGASTGSKIMASLFLHKRRHHRSSPSLEDDPFWLAMVACTNDADKGISVQCKGPKALLPREFSRTDSGLARRVQDSIQLDQCIPRQGACAPETQTKSRKGWSGGKQGKAFDQARYDDEEPLNSVKFSSRKVHHTHTADEVCHRHDFEENESMHSARLACKAVKALSMARTEMQGRCKTPWQQEGPPVVDISCGSRRSKSKGVGKGAKHKLPDLFGCKSNQPLILTSRHA
ncbi:hypothetical protein GOP47_0005592 [Adiantum capillus-veneris]|uniref:Uncharacterized protein n=1 Tax=Adiantum capillus-veneris TaxID=13818 RepID=A0A9D4V5N2_ADICA|nr:hypothetical protein GOP47_0005592 [Adiantum capillus-veneris]